MGSPEFAVRTLEALVQSSYLVVGVVTAPDRPAGRGRKVQESAVSSYAVKQGLPLLKPSNLKDPGFLAELRSLGANLQIVVAFRMLPKVVWQIPEFGTFNLHASLLPNYRGAAPINWAIINGETRTGVTTFFIDEKIDTGAIILQKEVGIHPEDTAGSLHDKLMRKGADLVMETVREIASGSARSQKQSTGHDLKTAPKLDAETCQIDWTKAGSEIHNQIRGLSPYPAASTTLYNGSEAIPLKITSAQVKLAAHQYAIGQNIIQGKEWKVAVRDGFLHLLEMQLSGRRKMPVREILNGLRLADLAHMA